MNDIMDNLTPENILEEFCKQSLMMYQNDKSQLKYVRKCVTAVSEIMPTITDAQILAELRRLGK